jgi:hypothetical protein
MALTIVLERIITRGDDNYLFVFPSKASMPEKSPHKRTQTAGRASSQSQSCNEKSSEAKKQSKKKIRVNLDISTGRLSQAVEHLMITTVKQEIQHKPRPQSWPAPPRRCEAPAASAQGRHA